MLDAAAPELKEIDVYESRSSASDVLRSLTAPLQNRGKTPQVISASLGTCEPALVESIGYPGVRAVEGALADGGGQRHLGAGLQRRRRLDGRASAAPARSTCCR